MGAPGRLELASAAGRRDGVRASSWRLDPDSTPGPEARELRILVTELTMASGTPAVERLLDPEIHLDDERALLRLYIKPIEGYVGRAAKQETPVIVRLPEPLGPREPVDGAVLDRSEREVSCWSADQQLNGRPSRRTSASRTRR